MGIDSIRESPDLDTTQDGKSIIDIFVEGGGEPHPKEIEKLLDMYIEIFKQVKDTNNEYSGKTIPCN